MAASTSFRDSANYGLQVGDNSGSITAEFHLHPERPKTPPKPSSTVPFRRDPDFVERGTLLDDIHEKVSALVPRIALVGLGGVGKSQLLVELSYRIRDRSPETWVFWIHASNAVRFEQSYREIADRLEVLGREDPKANIHKLVYDWLCDERKGKWVLMLDNLDEDRFLYEMPLTSRDGSEHDNSRTLEQPLFKYLPLSAHGSIIITTRSKAVAARRVDERNIAFVEPMDTKHARSLFEKKLNNQENQEDIMELIAALEYMPLAIVQAAAYIKRRAPRSSAKQYLQDFQKNDRKKISLLVDDHEGEQFRRDYEAKSSIILTWQISFDHIRQEWPTAADLLSLMSFFDRQGIADFLLRDRSESGNNRENVEEDWKNEITDDDEISTVESDLNDQFEDDIVTLRDFSLISISADGTSFQMHRLIQLAMQKWLEAHGQLEKWKQHFIRNLYMVFPKGEYENWKKCELLFPHARSAMAQRPTTANSLEEWTSLLQNATWFAPRKGNIFDAEEMAVKVMKVRKKVLGPEHESTLNSIYMAGMVLESLGKYEEAKTMHQRALTSREKVLGVKHPDTLASVNNLGSVLECQGKYEEAEAMYQRSLTGSEKLLGIEHPSTLASLSNLDSVLKKQGKYEEAEAMHRRSVTSSEKVLGIKHPHILG